MTDNEFDLADTEFRTAFQKRLRGIQGERTDEAMADLLGVNTDRYKKWKTRPGSQFPPFLLPRLSNIAGMSIKELILGPEQPKKRGAKTKQTRAA